MINEVVMGVEFIPYPYERISALMIGIGLFFHFLQMANFANPKSPWCFCIALASVAFSAIGLAMSAIVGNMSYMWNFGLGSAGAVLGLWLMLWYNGLHVNEFLESKYGKELP